MACAFNNCSFQASLGSTGKGENLEQCHDMTRTEALLSLSRIPF